MYVALFCLIGIVALAVISAQAWRDRARVAASVTPDWHDTLRRLATEQDLGHYRSAREKTLATLRRLESRRFDPRMAAHVRVRIASLMARDPVYLEVVRAIRKACAVLDISGGDSFSDIYGKRRFTAVTPLFTVGATIATPRASPNSEPTMRSVGPRPEPSTS